MGHDPDRLALGSCRVQIEAHNTAGEIIFVTEFTKQGQRRCSYNLNATIEVSARPSKE
jgi:hypothetical protein